MVKIYKQPFAHGGDTIAIPDASQPDGKISSADGWTPDYQLPKTDPNYKPVGRQEMNGVFKEVTEALGQVQVQGAASWSAEGAPYPINAQLYHNGKQWIALRANSVEPVEGEDWSELDGSLRQDLANPDKGASMVAFGDSSVSDALLSRVLQAATISDLRDTEPSFDGQQVILNGRGGGLFYHDASSDIADNGATHIVTTGGKRWVRSRSDYNAYMYGDAPVTVYVDPVGGDDRNTGLTITDPLATIQTAIDRSPDYQVYRYTIDLTTVPELPVTYDEDVLIRGKHAIMADPSNPRQALIGLHIEGTGPYADVHDPANCLIKSLTIASCTGVASPQLYGATFTSISPYYEQEEYVGIYGTQEVSLYNIATTATDHTHAGVRSYRSSVKINGIDVTGLRNAIWAKRGGSNVVQNAYGIQAAGSTYRAEEGSEVTYILDSVTGRSDERSKINTNYGMVYTRLGTERVRQMYYGMLLDGTELGQDAFAAGYRVSAEGSSVVAIGLNAKANGDGGVAIGVMADSGTGISSCTAVGQDSGANGGRRATAIGSATRATFENSTAVGYNAVASKENTIKLGNASVSAVETQNAYEVLGNSGSIFLKSPNGTRYRLSISDTGEVVVAAAP